MDTVSIMSAQSIGRDFIPSQYIDDDKDEYFFRNKQTSCPLSKWRNLRSDEIESLVKNNNSSDNWDQIFVTDSFDPIFISNTEFFGLVRIGAVRNIILKHHDLKVRTDQFLYQQPCFTLFHNPDDPLLRKSLPHSESSLIK